MTPEDILQHISEQLQPDSDLDLGWQAGGAEMPSPVPDFVEDGNWLDSMRYAGFDDSHLPEIAGMALQVREDSLLLRLIWQAYWRVYLDKAKKPIKGWPTLDGFLGERSGLFYFLVALAGIPLVRRHHRALGIPEEVTRNTCQQVRVESVAFYKGSYNGKFGVDYPQLEWLSHYTRELYFRLGRLEFWLEPNKVCPARVFRNRVSGAVVALSPEGAEYAADGSIPANPGEGLTGTGWKCSFLEDGDSYKGYVISPFGRGTRWRVSLPKSEWDSVLKPGDLCLTTHIPNGGGLTPEACVESVSMARDFFPRFFPDRLPKALVSHSWLFNNQVRQVFPASSNICTFIDQFHSVPVPSGPWNGLWFLFLRKGAPDFDAWPRDTTPQRLVLDFLSRGHTWRESAMFMLWDDTRYFGSRHYVSHWPNPALGGLSLNNK